MRLTIAIVLTVLFVSFTVSEVWDSLNDPKIYGLNFQYNFASLPLRGTASKQPWSDTYWPTATGGIAYRYQMKSSNVNMFSDTRNFPWYYSTYSVSQLQNMDANSAARIVAGLSPAEKYDLFMGRSDYPTLKAERSRTSPYVASWEGLCHGWTPAAVYYSEPQPITVASPFGFNIQFGSSDIKALLTYYLGVVSSGISSYIFIGRRCKTDIQANPGAASRIECADVNAGTFHILIGNIIGLRQRNMMGDIDRSIQVWNQPMYAYTSTVVSSTSTNVFGSGSNVARQVRVRTTLYYANEVNPSASPVGTNSASRNYEYLLDLDYNGNIVGGTWISYQRNDFQTDFTIAPFSGYYTGIGTLYSYSTGQVSTSSVEDDQVDSRANFIKNTVIVPDAPEVSVSSSEIDSDIMFLLTDNPRTDIISLEERNYTNNARISWSLKCSNDSISATRTLYSANVASIDDVCRIQLDFLYFDTEHDNDVLRIFDGQDYNAPIIAILSGSNIPDTLVSTGSNLYMEFISDDSETHKGFTLHYSKYNPSSTSTDSNANTNN